MKKQITTSIVLVALAIAAPVAAQDRAAPRSRPQAAAASAAKPPINMGEMRHHIYVMEGALARAVDYGAKQLNREILAVMPGVFMLEGEAHARGVYLEGYGVFFDVRVPMMRQSMMWSLRMMMDQDDAANQAAINDLRKYMQGITDPQTRASLEKAVRQLERQARQCRAAQSAGRAGRGDARDDVARRSARRARPACPPRVPRRAAADSLWAKDPNRAYTEAVTRALVDAMIDYSTPMAIARRSVADRGRARR